MPVPVQYTERKFIINNQCQKWLFPVIDGPPPVTWKPKVVWEARNGLLTKVVRYSYRR